MPPRRRPHQEIIHHHEDEGEYDSDEYTTHQPGHDENGSESDVGQMCMEEEEEEEEYHLTDDAQLDILEQKIALADSGGESWEGAKEYMRRVSDNYLHWQKKLIMAAVEQAGDGDGDVEARREIKKYFTRLCTARETFAEKWLICDEAFWMQWIQEEQYWWLVNHTPATDSSSSSLADTAMVSAEGRDSTAMKVMRGVRLAVSSDDVKNLFERALSQCPSMPSVWHMYCEFMITASVHETASTATLPQEKVPSQQQQADESALFDLQAARIIFERALVTCGTHMSQCQILWNLYREWVAALEVEDVKKMFDGEQTDIIRSSFQRQLAIPHFDIDQTLALYREWEKDEKQRTEMEQIYAGGVQLMRERITFETPLAVFEEKRDAPPESITPQESNKIRQQQSQEWLRYMEFEKQKRTTQSVIALFERSVRDCAASDSIWKNYLAYLEDKADNQSPDITDKLILSVCNRAVKGCPTNPSLWVSALVNQEFLGTDFATMQKTFNRAQESGALKKPVDYEALFLAYCGYLKRLTEANPEGEQIRSELRDTLRTCCTTLSTSFAEHDASCAVQRLWAHVEVSLFQDTDRARQVFEQHVVSPFGAQHAKHWLYYISFELMFIRDVAAVRSLFHRGVSMLKNGFQVQQLGQQWVEFEQTWGHHVNCVHYASKFVEQRVSDISQEREKQRTEMKQTKKKQGKEETTTDRKQKKQPRKDKKETKGKATAEKLNGRAQEEKKGKKRPRTTTQGEKPLAETKGDNGPITKKQKKEEKLEAEEGERDGDLTLFLWNLPYTLERDDLTKFFQDAGCMVENVRIVKDKRGAPRGFAYMDLQDQSSVSIALQLDDQKVKGRTMRVSVSQPPKTQEDKEKMKKEAQREKQKRQEVSQTMKLTVRKRRGQMMVPRSVSTRVESSAKQPIAGDNDNEEKQEGSSSNQPLSNADFKNFLLG